MPEGRLGRARHCALVLPGGSCHGRAPRAHTLAAGSSLYSLSPALPGAAPQGWLLFSQYLLDSLVLQASVGKHLFEALILVFQVLEPRQFGDTGPGILALPGGNVASLRPCSRTICATVCPLACCCRVATIWASLNRPFFISQLSGSEKTLFSTHNWLAI